MFARFKKRAPRRDHTPYARSRSARSTAAAMAAAMPAAAAAVFDAAGTVFAAAAAHHAARHADAARVRDVGAIAGCSPLDMATNSTIAKLPEVRNLARPQQPSTMPAPLPARSGRGAACHRAHHPGVGAARRSPF